ncbi:MAG: FliA/WhiG family RNA polymerase sigma factor [Dehalococcoidia bacterium]
MKQPEGSPGRPSPAEIQKRWERFVKSPTPALRESLILQYTPLVKYVVGRLAIGLPAIMDYEDVLSDGTIGLIEAVSRFDPSKGVKFETYAISRIRGAIIDQLRKADRLPRSTRQNLRKVEQAAQALRGELDREPTEEEVAESVGISLDRYYNILTDAAWVTVSLDNLLDGSAEGEGYPAAEMPKDPDADDVSQAVERKETISALADTIQELPERERLVVALYYQDELTQREIAKVLGISESRVCQLHARALGRLRTGMREREAA